MTDRTTNPLQRLIRERLHEQGWSYGDVARRGALPRSTVYNLARTRNLTRPPRPATIDGLARGLGVPVSAVRAAAAESTGLHYYDEAPRDQGHVAEDDAAFLTDAADQPSPAVSDQHRSMASGPAPFSPDDLAEAVRAAFQRPAGVESLARWTAADPGSALQPGAESGPGPGGDPAQLLLRTVMLLTSPTARRYWEDDLGLDPAAAAETADWAIRTLTSAQRAQREAEPR
jgi:transcriptional regulator with XRE-family HTH domain